MKLLSKLFSKPIDMNRQMPPGDLIREAKANPGGWVYEISGKYDPNGEVPPHAIKGAWRVSQADEVIPGSYQANPNFRADD
ncbi:MULTISPECIES: hypothetical protein [Xanthomonas]|uniref:hypothetical protein n=1 Tax=Xanthomonas TaxID=338 RepID=UPI000F8DC52F|nr:MULTISPECIES: hypothetical protein [Xanthomonas]MCC8472378.1 hypothetical protein [Xanthomonas phaseoli]